MQLKKLFQEQDDSSHSEYFVMNNLELINFLCSLINIDPNADNLSDCLTKNAETMDIIFDKHLLPLTNILIENHEFLIRYDLLNILTVHFYAQIDKIIDTSISSEEKARAGNSWILHFKKLYSELREKTKTISIDDSNFSELFLDCSAYKIPKYIPVSFSFSAEELVAMMETIANMEQIFDFFNRHPKNLITIFLLTNPKSDKHIQLLEAYQFTIEEERKCKLEEEQKHKLEEERKRKLEEERKRKLELAERKLELAERKLELAERKLEVAKQRKLEEERKRKSEEDKNRKLEEDKSYQLNLSLFENAIKDYLKVAKESYSARKIRNVLFPLEKKISYNINILKHSSSSEKKNNAIIIEKLRKNVKDIKKCSSSFTYQKKYIKNENKKIKNIKNLLDKLQE